MCLYWYKLSSTPYSNKLIHKSCFLVHSPPMCRGKERALRDCKTKVFRQPRLSRCQAGPTPPPTFVFPFLLARMVLHYKSYSLW
jgi:hypothetical protein